MAKKFKSCLCVHCLRHTDTPTSDHVFPRSWYPESTPPDLEKWQIPTCSPCNHKFGQIEEDLLMRMGMCLDDNAIASLGLGGRVVRALDPTRGRNARDAEARAKRATKLLGECHAPKGDRPIVQASPNTSGEAIGIRRDSLEKVGEKIIRGLIYINLNRYVGQEDEVVCDAIPGLRPEFDATVQRWVRWIPKTGQVGSLIQTQGTIQNVQEASTA